MRLGTDVSNPPPEFAFVMTVFNDAAPTTPAVEPTEVAFKIERVFTRPFMSRDPYAGDAVTRTVAA